MFIRVTIQNIHLFYKSLYSKRKIVIKKYIYKMNQKNLDKLDSSLVSRVRAIKLG